MASNQTCMLTTVDNPYDPFDEFTKWLLFDNEKGYNTCGYLGRIVRQSDELTDEENEALRNEAIDEIIKYDFRNIYTRAYPRGHDGPPSQRKHALQQA